MLNELREIYNQLGVSVDCIDSYKVFKQCASDDLVSVGVDVFNRPVKMEKKTHIAWLKMQAQAQQEGVDLAIVSAFRSYQYQAGIINRKLKKGLKIDEIIKVSALPGLSEHHTGRALDLTSFGEKEVLTESFETTEAFCWLTSYAKEFGFLMSYPKNNNKGFIYEPWHWCYQA